ncbi:hypothetical protein [Actinoallomurus sp. CA-150999]|uniref:hypothetical protein n=1 Tax=Actinoallomurus sp. CA-150999 TaxID=3239887 RepID=UPI003D912705
MTDRTSSPVAALERPEPSVSEPVDRGATRRSRVWWWLWAWTVLWTVIRLPGAGGSWHYFAQGGHLLFDDEPGQGMHLYAAHPELQIGPISFLVAAPLQLLGSWPGRIVALVLMSATGPPLLGALWKLVPTAARRPSRLLTAGLVFLPVWAELVTHAGHLDDVLALGFGVAAMRALVRGNPIATGLLVAAAADSKPWAAAFAPLLLALPRRHWWRAAVFCALGLAVAWLPFLLYDPNTLAATRFTIPTAVSSGLRTLGFTDPRTPAWDRPAQLLLGCALGTAAVIRGRWPAIILLATAARILLDPEVYSYYTAGVLLGAVAFDLIATRWRGPWLTTGGLLVLHVARLAGHLIPISLHALGVLRVAYVIAVVGVVLLPGRRDRRGGYRRGPFAHRQPHRRTFVAEPPGAEPLPASATPRPGPPAY